MTPSDDWISDAVREFSAALTLYATHLLGDLDRGRDAVQETFIKLCAQPRDQVQHKLKQWLYLVCRNQALDVLRKESRMLSLDENYEPPDPAHSGPAVLEQREQSAGILSALDTLPLNQREAIRLKFLHGHSYREISAITNLTEGNIGFLIHTGLKTLRQKLAAPDFTQRSTI